MKDRLKKSVGAYFKSKTKVNDKLTTSNVTEKQMVKAVVFDRDGTLVKYGAYLYKPEDMVIYSGVFDACRLLQDHGIHLFIATNQSGIARGYFSEQDYRLFRITLNAYSLRMGLIFKTYYCPSIQCMVLVNIKKNPMIENPIQG